MTFMFIPPDNHRHDVSKINLFLHNTVVVKRERGNGERENEERRWGKRGRGEGTPLQDS